MDPLLPLGLLVSILAIILAMFIDGNSLGVLIGPSSAVLVIFGSIGAAFMAYRMPDVKRLPGILKEAFTGTPPDVDETIRDLAMIADVSRREGMLALESRLEDIDDPAIRSAAQLIVDGTDADQVRELIDIDIAAVSERHQTGIGLFKSIGGYSPTFGMVGTVIGLVNMLQNLTDPSQLGIGMALALLTTLYGVMFANLVWLPIANRLERLNELELSVRDMVLDAVLSIQAGVSPRMLVERLETYLPPGERVGYQARADEHRAAAAPASKAA